MPAYRRVLPALLALSLLVAGSSLALAAPAAERVSTAQGELLVLRNAQMSLGFDAQTGRLLSLVNLATGDEYLKDAAPVAGPFQVYAGLDAALHLRPGPRGSGSDPDQPGGV